MISWALRFLPSISRLPLPQRPLPPGNAFAAGTGGLDPSNPPRRPLGSAVQERDRHEAASLTIHSDTMRSRAYSGFVRRIIVSQYWKADSGLPRPPRHCEPKRRNPCRRTAAAVDGFGLAGLAMTFAPPVESE